VRTIQEEWVESRGERRLEDRKTGRLGEWWPPFHSSILSLFDSLDEDEEFRNSEVQEFRVRDR
jgi:hypothetical protein